MTIRTALLTALIATFSAPTLTSAFPGDPLGRESIVLNDAFALPFTGDYQDRLDTASTSIMYGRQLSEGTVLTYGAGGHIYSPLSITKEQAVDEPDYVSWASARVGVQHQQHLSFGTLQVGGTLGVDVVSNLVEAGQTAIHELFGMDTASDNLRRQADAVYGAYSANALLSIPVADQLSIQPHGRVEYGYMDTRTAGIGLHYGSERTLLGYERTTGAQYDLYQDSAAGDWNFNLNVEWTEQLDVPHFDGPGAVGVFRTTSLEVSRALSDDTAFTATIVHMANKFEGQTDNGGDGQVTVGLGLQRTH